MPKFNYKAKDKAGQNVVAAIDAPSRLDALATLRDVGLTVLDLWTDSDPVFRPVLPERVARSRLFQPSVRVSGGEKAVFMRQLSISVGAGMPLREALESIAEDLENPGFKRVVQNMVGQLREGRMFSEAAGGHPAVFSKLFVALLRVAEEAGSMPQTLEYLATALERGDKLARKIRSIVAYPVFVAGFFVLVCGIMTLVVLPKFQAIFGAKSNLPTLTRVVFGANRFILDNILLIAIGLIGSVLLCVLYSRTEVGSLQVDTLKLRLPVIGPCVQKFAVARFCRNFAIMVRGGVPVASAMEIATGICGNKAMEKALVRVRERILCGSTIAGALGAEVVFPRLIVRMVGIGESSGKLPQVLDKVSDTYEDQVEGSITLATALFEPVIICFFGLFVLVLVLAIYMPVFTASRGMQ